MSNIPFSNRFNEDIAIGYDTEQLNECALITEAHNTSKDFENVFDALIELWGSGKYQSDPDALVREEKIVCAIRGWNAVNVAALIHSKASLIEG